ncbi:alpha-ketoacid dehydrogenase subunit beta [Mesomycoplasma hyorhinis]|jgi:pyruvate dehydrogenase E1 component beta subunit|uniref:Alpha-ketoacid dehydrogenase subunit beta n=4 Tax=Mesomycoplasma hyorhinis TaxID=2100 RepID=A0AAJ5NRR4_MESHY|nr:alpha-ketoacid dehydrogenase subunit beta [Mesomycoplasma hyorhinis]ADM21973.1 Pyruvate dehydrogenase E1 component beta subunit [Mesomycoplasma hyorhinis HUB-1]AEC46194.1 Pyruvate dehydrogenase E1 component beta subunit [Mesomycoplasma hyorhinis MCLD]AEX14294.1 pyruvate dehydrogenase E1 component subunit beta [Mesomycoplasma hyorhinis GDL-1]AFX74498.1 Pyruvate dehydrogenase E1 component beta subunit [Mesomycoplasma hyorhinis SK76]AHA41304.1 pyruvate dehydrogenase E1 component subunit beta [
MSTKALNNIGAVTDALALMMEKDPTVVLWGEDAGFEGGVFRATEGLQKQFGISRVFDAPIAEATIAGVGVGAALYGLKPVVEMQFQGFSYPAFQQLMAHAARYRNRTRGRFTVPMVVRMPMAGGVRALEHHSEAIEALYAHIPGLKVVMPSTPYDTKGLLIAAINDPDPVIFLEPKKIYRSFKQEVPAGIYEVEIGKANVLVEGSDLTLVTYGAQVHEALAALKQLNGEYSVELIDLRTISPLDTDTIINSVKKTGRLLVVHEAVKSFSVSAEIITRVNEKAFEFLLAPPARLTGYDITVPLARGEGFHAINDKKILNKIKEVMSFEG